MDSTSVGRTTTTKTIKSHNASLSECTSVLSMWSKDHWTWAFVKMQIPGSHVRAATSGCRHRGLRILIYLVFLLNFLLWKVSNINKSRRYMGPRVSQIQQLSTFCQTSGICIFNKHPRGIHKWNLLITVVYRHLWETFKKFRC